MSFLTILDTLLLGPLKLIFELIFVAADSIVGHSGYAIIFLSLAMNFLVLPLYRRADAMQEKARDVEAKLHDGVAHIKKTFTGDERMMILQTYYRQNNYKPTDALNGSVSLLLEIPFFMAAYQFLSHLDVLNNVSFGPIANLGAPDGLLVIGGVAINVLPVLMTLINVISSAIYLKGFPLKTKIQLYAMALFFLVFLYESPACLVFYWTLNNIFSLCKNVFYKLKNPKKALCILASVVGFALLAYGLFFFDDSFLREKGYAIGAGWLFQIPMVLYCILVDDKRNVTESKKPKTKKNDVVTPNRKLFLLGGLFLTLFIGVLIPSNVIVASPQEFVDITYYFNPLWYIVSTVCLAAGTFLVWMGVFYWLASPKGKVIFERVIWILCGIMLVDYMFFGTDLGIISASLKYENGLSFTVLEQVINIAVLAAVVLAMWFVMKKWKRAVPTVLLVGAVSLGAMSAINVFSINKSIKEISLEQADQMPKFELSKTGDNVIVFMLDRGMASYVPYLFNEDPHLQEQFAGFTFYKNTISFGRSTNFGVPPLLGGYEYTPVEMNKRDEESLASKQNEALKVMPVLFSENGFDVTVCDPVYANYQWIPDLSIFDEYPEIDAYITKGQFSDNDEKQKVIDNTLRNFFCFGLLKSMPLSVQNTLYNDGNYNKVGTHYQKAEGIYTSMGYNPDFHDPYNVLLNMDTMTNVTDKDKDTFLFISNETAHEPMLLQTPDYVPSFYVDNTEYETENADRFTLNGITLKMKNAYGLGHYHANMAAMKQLGAWFDYLRAEGVYDNTKIILVADHGQHLYQISELVKNGTDLCSFYPMLMVKDFNSTEFTVSDEFMTNADVPTIAFDGLIENPVNPFTGKPINSDEKYAHEQFIILSGVWDVNKNNGNTFLPSKWASVSDDFWNKSNWTFYKGEMVLKDHYVK